jgi:hypothetical protein
VKIKLQITPQITFHDEFLLVLEPTKLHVSQEMKTIEEILRGKK